MQHTLRDYLRDISDFLPWIPDWIFGIAAFIGIVAAGLALQGLVSRFLKKRPGSWHPFARHAWDHTRRLMRFMLVLFAASLALPFLHLPHDARDEVRKIFLALAVVQLGWIIGVIANIAIDRYVYGFKIDVADNLTARKAVTQMRILRQAVNVLIALITAGFALMSFDSVRQYGVSLFASAGVAGIVAGLAARPLFENLIAGLQLAFTQPLRLGDAVVIANEYGTVEEIGSVYIVIRCWDLRRLIVPLSYIFTNPFTNWTRSSSSLIGTVVLYLDYTLDVEILRKEAERLARTSPLWDSQVVSVQVIDATEYAMQVRVLVSAGDAGKAWDLRCFMREQLIAFVRKHHHSALPRRRQEASLHAGNPETPDDGTASPAPG
jgi:small-conductance mechanosensitive channel